MIHLILTMAGWILLATALTTLLATAVNQVLSWTDPCIQHVCKWIHTMQCFHQTHQCAYVSLLSDSNNYYVLFNS